MEMALEIVMPWLSAQDVGELGRTCRAMAEAAKLVTERRVGDATQGWENIRVPIENDVDDCLYPNFQYTPFSRLSAPLEHRFGGPWGGGGEVAESRRRGLSESEFGGAMVTGSVLHGAGIGCRCANDCHMESHPLFTRGSPGCFSAKGAGRSTCSISRRLTHLETPETLEKGLSKMGAFQEDIGDRTCSHSAMQDQLKRQEGFEKASLSDETGHADKRKRLSGHASSCPCGRFKGGELAYDSESRLCIQHMNGRKRSKVAERVAVGSLEMLETNTNLKQVQRDMPVDSGKALVGIYEPPLVMECGQVCLCSYLCKYRVSQKGLAVSAKVMRTSSKGWGLWATQKIKRGSFVCEYAGELITIFIARERQKLYDSKKHGKHWQGSALLTLREHLPSGQVSVRLNVDATRVGNVARFINHSCDGGNLMTCLIRIAGSIIPKLALFARRDISDGEELTYSYGTADKDSETWESCYCGTTACLGRLPSEST